MILRALVGFSLSASIILVAAAGATLQAPSSLSAAEIVEKNVTARGGLSAWRGVTSMSLAGKLGAGGNQRATLPRPALRGKGREVMPSRPVEEVQLPFVMELKRPRKMRFELEFAGQTAVQVFDGTNGWKLRPYLNRRVVEPYTSDEMKIASMQADLDGPLVDYAVKGTRVESAGMEKVEGRDTYKLKLTMKSGQAINVWIDAQTFLETKIQGTPRRLDGIDHPVEVYFRDYRPMKGLQIPFVLETKVLQVSGAAVKDAPVQSEKTVIESVTLNPPLDEALFSQPTTVVTASTSPIK